MWNSKILNLKRNYYKNEFTFRESTEYLNCVFLVHLHLNCPQSDIGEFSYNLLSRAIGCIYVCV